MIGTLMLHLRMYSILYTHEDLICCDGITVLYTEETLWLIDLYSTTIVLYTEDTRLTDLC